MTPKYITLNLDGHRLSAICLNPGAPGEPVILLHGITSSTSFWQANPPPYLLELGPCYALSLPGHFPALTQDEFKSGILTAERLVSLLEAGIRQLVGERPVTLFGHSTGGFFALAFAARYPERVHRLVSISGFAHGRWIGILGLYQRAVRLGWVGETYFKVMFRSLNPHPSLYRWAMRFYAADARALYAHPDLPEAVQRNFPPYRQLDLDALLPYFRHMPDIDITSQLNAIQSPTLLIAGDCDPIVPPAQSRLIAEHIPPADLVMLAGAGHLPFLERPAEYHQQVSAWLAQSKKHKQ
jgi:pimeloyl-ACP methyl ester carboxylesterase